MAPDKLSLAGKVAIVTGSGSENGIGAAIATALARNGANVAINYVSSSSASRIAKVASAIRELGVKVAVVQADVSTSDGAAALVSNTLNEFQTKILTSWSITLAPAPAKAHSLSASPPPRSKQHSTSTHSAHFIWRKLLFRTCHEVAASSTSAA